MLDHLKRILGEIERDRGFQLTMYTEMHERFNELNDKIETYMSLVEMKEDNNKDPFLEALAKAPIDDESDDVLVENDDLFARGEVIGRVVIEELREKPSLVKLAEELREAYRVSDKRIVELANETIELIMEHEDMIKWMKECTGYKDCFDMFLLHMNRY